MIGKVKLVVIGGGAAGMSAASRAVRLRPGLEVTVVERDKLVSVARCSLPFYITEKAGAENLQAVDNSVFEEERGINILAETTALSIDRTKRLITVKRKNRREEQLPYDKLILATGAKQKIPNNLNVNLEHPGIVSLRTKCDADKIKSALKAGAKKVAIVGAGSLGLELASLLCDEGLDVTLLEAKENPWEEYSKPISEKIMNELSKSRINFSFNTPVLGLKTDSKQVTLLTDNNELSPDLLILATGYLPSAELAAEAGLKIDDSGAVLTDKLHRTSDFNIFAAGDSATVMCRLTSKPLFFPSGALANKTGYNCGSNTAGINKAFPGTLRSRINMFGDCFFGKTGLDSGLLLMENYDYSEITVEAPVRPGYISSERLVETIFVNNRNGKLLGGQVFGCSDAATELNIITQARSSGCSIEQLENVDFAYTPAASLPYRPLTYAIRKALKVLADNR